MPIRITGLNSGLDTEAIISALVSSYNYKTDKYKKAQTKLSWKQDAWKTLNSKIYSLYKNVGNLRLSNAYNTKTSTVSDNTKVTVKAGSSSVNGTYSIQVTNLAKAGYLTGGKLANGTTMSTKLADLGYTGGDGTISLTTGGKTTDITVTGDTTIQELVVQLKESGVNASYDETNRRFYVSAKDSGVENDFSLSGGNTNGTAVLSALGLNVASTAATAEYTELAGYANLTADEIKAISDGKMAATTQNTELTQTNVYLSNAISYAKASAAINTVGDGKDAKEFDLLKTLACKSSLDDTYVDSDNHLYTKDSDSGKYSTVKELTGGTYDSVTNTYTAADGTVYSDGSYVDGTYYAKVEVEDVSTFMAASEKYGELAESFGLITDQLDEEGNAVTDSDGKTVKDATALAIFKNNLTTVSSISQKAEASGQELQDMLAAANVALENGTVDTFVSDSETAISNNESQIETNNATLAANSKIKAGMTDDEISAFMEKAAYAAEVVADPSLVATSTEATRIDGEDAVIYVNGAEYTGTSNTFSINGLTITATGVTGSSYDATEASAVTATVNTDTQGIYDKIKDFLTQYNALINEMTSLYNAESAKGYDPLTDDEKDAMSDTEVEKWEAKIKASLLRRDDTLQSVMNAMTAAMSKGVEIDGKNYYLSSFGIKTLGYLNAAQNEHNAYHIDGDEDDSATAGNEDKLMAAIAQDPDKVIEFMQGLANNLYDAVDKKMKSTTLKSIYNVYNDKEMASEYSDYTDLIKKWEERLQDKEDYYYNKFSAMETALAKLNSQTSSMSGLFG